MRSGANPRRDLSSGPSTVWCSLGCIASFFTLDALTIVRPETVVRWHHAGFRSFWRWKSGRRGGRPSVPLEIRRLIRGMSLANPLWGAPRIHGELLSLGIDVGQTSVAKYMARRRGGSSQGWAGGPFYAIMLMASRRWTCSSCRRFPSGCCMAF